MPCTLTREQRDALHAEAIAELTEIGDLYLALANDDYRLEQELWRRYEPLLVLLDQVGWEPKRADDATAVEVAMPDAQLASAAARLPRVALGRLRHQIDQQQLEHDPDAESPALHRRHRDVQLAPRRRRAPARGRRPRGGLSDGRVIDGCTPGRARARNAV